jgi:hypothetical protein
MFNFNQKLMRSIFTFMLTAAFSGIATLATAQAGRQAIIANGNLFTAGNYATIASFQFNNQAYQVFDSVGARSVQDVLIEGNVAYVAADSTILRYDIDTYTRQASVVAPGVRKLAYWDGKLVATMGFGAANNYVRVFDGTTLNPLFAIAGLSGECEGISIWGDTAVVAVPIGFGASNGKVAVIDLGAQTLRTEVDLDSNGRGIERLYNANGKVWGLSTIAFANSYCVLTEFDPTSLAFTSHRVDYPGSGSVGIHSNRYFVRRGPGLFSFDLSSTMVVDTLLFPNHSYAAGVINPLNGDYLLTETDYFSFGNFYQYGGSGSLLHTLPVGISPEALAVDTRQPLGASEPGMSQQLGLWPNPATDMVSFRLTQPLRQAHLRVVDALGRDVLTRTYNQVLSASLPVADLPAGLYHVVLRSGDQQLVGRFLK